MKNPKTKLIEINIEPKGKIDDNEFTFIFSIKFSKTKCGKEFS